MGHRVEEVLRVMAEAGERFDLPAPGAIGWLTVAAENPDTWLGRWRTGPLGMRIAPLPYSGSPFSFRGARLRGTRCVWSASTISGATLSRPARWAGPKGWEHAVHLIARVAAPGSVFDGPSTGRGVLRTYWPEDEIIEQFDRNTHIYTLNIPRSAVGVEVATLQRLREEPVELSRFQLQVLRSAVGLLDGTTEDLSTGASLVGLDRYLAALAGLLLRTSVVRRSGETLGDNLRARSDLMIFEEATDPDLTPAALAQRLSVSLRHLYRAYDGSDSPAARIRRRRLERAAEMLAGDDLSGPGMVERVAAACGFTSTEYFSRAFRKEFGVSPRSYRSAHRAR